MSKQIIIMLCMGFISMPSFAHAGFTYVPLTAPLESKASPAAQPSVPKKPDENKSQVIVKALSDSRQESERKSSLAGPSTPVAPVPAVPSAQAARPLKAAEPEPLMLSAPAAPASFELHEGSLREQVEAYAKLNGSTVSWKAGHDVHIKNRARVTGNFESSMNSIFEAIRQSGHDIAAVYYRGNRVLVVTDGQR